MENRLEHYHYIESGLTDVWLVNGFEKIETPYGEAVTIHDMDGLHRLLGERIARGTSNLSGQEVRFLRHELDLSQSALAGLIGVDEQSVARWEKGSTKVVPGPAQRLIRALYLSSVEENSDLAALLNNLSQADTEMDEEPIEVELGEDENWTVRAA